MSRSGIIILALIFLVLGTYVYFFELEQQAEEKQPEPFVIEKLIEFDPNDVLEITLNRKDGRTIFQRRGDRWMLTEPTEAPAREDRVSDLLAVFDYGIVREITSEPTPSELQEYGLDQPNILLKLVFKGDTSPRILLLGKESPSGSCCYGKMKDQQRVVLLGIRYKMDLERNVDFYLE